MNLSHKCQYGLRAIFELAKHQGEGAISSSTISKVQAIPLRFLELILGELKRAGYIDSRRGSDGGYILAKPPEELTIGEIIRFIDGPLDPVSYLAIGGSEPSPDIAKCAFMNLWERAKKAIEAVYDNTTFADLIREETEERNSNDVSSYTV